MNKNIQNYMPSIIIDYFKGDKIINTFPPILKKNNIHQNIMNAVSRCLNILLNL